MAYLSIDDQAADHPKLEALSDKAFRLWFKGITYCQRFLTNGVIPPEVARGLRGWSKATQDELAKVTPPFSGPLWEVAEDGTITVHDYLAWNDSRDEVLKRRGAKADRMKAWRDKKAAPSQAREPLRDVPRAPTHNHNHTVAKATHGAPLVGRRNTKVLNEGDPVPFPTTLSEEFQSVIQPRLSDGEDPWNALMAWVHRVSDETVAEYGSAPEAMLEDSFKWWRARLAADWGAKGPARPTACRNGHKPACATDAECTRRYLDSLAQPVEGR
jgi:hypothetical protein